MYYKVIRAFTDLQDDNYVYNVGDVFPHGNDVVDNARLLELSTTENKRGEILIKAIKEADDTDDTEDDVSEGAEEVEIQPESGESEAVEESVAEPEKAPKRRKKKE